MNRLPPLLARDLRRHSFSVVGTFTAFAAAGVLIGIAILHAAGFIH